MRDIKNLLVFHIGHLGDTIMILPSFWALRDAFPHGRFTLLTDRMDGEGYVNAADLFSSDFFAEIIIFSKSADGDKRHLRSLVELWPKLRARRFEAVAYLTPSRRQKRQILRDRLYFRSLGIGRLLGFRGFGPFTGEMAKLHEAERILRRLSKDGIPVGRISFDLLLNQADDAEAQKLLEEKGLSLDDEHCVAVAPFSKMQAKRWPMERYAALIERLIADFAVFPIVLGGRDEKEQGDALINYWKTGLNAAGLKVRATAALLRRCRSYIGNDTGAMHLAASVGVPCLAIFSARDEPYKWRPYGDGHIVLRREIECAGCLLTHCEHRSCLMQITVDEATEKARELLRRGL
ncbi:MAG: glycosyltransferase family 9 protein [candidate division KSB1 bacterium]|nr:glycosyltransferase family 9 protein [candidate division KSB1 bacterium]